MASCETYFPRGSVRTAEPAARQSNNKRRFKDNYPFKLQLFNKKQFSKKKNEPVKREQEKKEVKNAPVRLNSVSHLQYDSLQEGFVVLGCVKEVFPTLISVNLPGRLVGQVKINNVSTPYSSLLSSYANGDVLPQDVPTLKDLFKIGELIICYVIEVLITERGSHKVKLSLNPSDVNQNKTERILEENVTLVGAVKSKEDHGYVVDVGIEGVTTFLPFKSTFNYLKSHNLDFLPIGKIIRVAVKKVLRANVGVTAIKLTLDPDVLSKAVPRSGFMIDNLTPGQQVNVFIKQIIYNGIEVSPVHAFENYCSYVNLAYVPDVWGSTSGLVPGKVFPATLLYTLSPVNILYFSLKRYSKDLNLPLCFKDGAVIDDAKVITATKYCYYLQLGSKNLNAKGYVSSKQCKNLTNVTIGQSVKTRILSYDFLENVYICTLNKDIISAEVFSTKELTIGQTVKCSVTGFLEGKGLLLKLGTLKAFAPLYHLTDYPHKTRNTLVNLYKNSSVVTAKILQITEGNEVIVTLKPTLVSSEALCSYEDAVIRKCYYGTILNIFDSGIDVLFFGGVHGYIPNRLIASYVTGLSKESFHEGQVIRCYVVERRQLERKLILSLIPDAASDLKLGSSYGLEVVLCNESGIEVIVTDTDISGFVPIHQVTDHLDLLNSVIKNYSSGTIIENAVLYSFKEDLTPFFSLRTFVKKFLKENPVIFSDSFANLTYNINVPCSVNKVDHTGFHLYVTLPGFNDPFFIPQKNLSEDQQNLENFKENLALMAVVSPKKGSLELDVSSSKFVGDYKISLEILEDYLNLAKKFQLVNVGETYKVKVSSVTENEVNVKLSGKKLFGSCRKELTSMDYTKNYEFEALILWQDPRTHHCYIHPDLQLSQKTAEKTKKFGGSVEEAQILLVLKELSVGVILSGNCKGHLTFIPIRTHFNNFSSKKPSLLSIVRVIPYKLANGLIISEREKRIKEISKITGENSKEIINKLLHNTFSENIINNVKESNKRKRRKSLESIEKTENDYDLVGVKKSRKSSSNDFHFKIKSSIGEGLVNEKLVEKFGNSISDKNNFLNVADVNHNNSNEQGKNNVCNGAEGSMDNIVKKKKNSFSVSPIQSRKNNITFTGNSDVLNGFNVSSLEAGQSEGASVKKKRKDSSSLNEEKSDDVDIKFTSIITLTDNMKNDISDSANDSINFEKENYVLRKKCKKKRKDNSCSSKSNIQTDLEEDSEPVNKDNFSKKNEKPRLSGSGGFTWNVNVKDFSIGFKNDEDDGFEEDDIEDVKILTRPKTAAEKRAAAKETEKHLRQAEQQLLEAELNPQSVDHFERLTLAQPNNSLIWVKYMAYHLQATEIEKARAVANRALKVISHREEQERLNVTVALLNLENLYGSQEDLKKTLDEAVRTNDEYQVYSKMAEIYTDSNKTLELDQLTSVMVKKFKTDLECWLLCCQCLLKSGLSDKARSIFQRGLQVLMKKDHVQYIIRFALMENTFGSSEHAQTLMEHVLTTYPGKISTWITYIDMLTKSGQTDLARNILERSVGQKLPVKKMKTLYKKWLQFEEKYGSETSVNHVREAAESYVNSLNAKIDSV